MTSNLPLCRHRSCMFKNLWMYLRLFLSKCTLHSFVPTTWIDLPSETLGHCAKLALRIKQAQSSLCLVHIYNGSTEGQLTVTFNGNVVCILYEASFNSLKGWYSWILHHGDKIRLLGLWKPLLLKSCLLFVILLYYFYIMALDVYFCCYIKI